MSQHLLYYSAFSWLSSFQRGGGSLPEELPDEPELITITFMLNNDDTTVYQVQVLAEGESIIIPENPKHPTDHALFNGWYLNPECTGDKYDFESEITGDLTLYAKWIRAAVWYQTASPSSGGSSVCPDCGHYCCWEIWDGYYSCGSDAQSSGQCACVGEGDNCPDHPENDYQLC